LRPGWRWTIMALTEGGDDGSRIRAVQAAVGQTGRVAREVAEMQGIASAVPVAGPYDVIAIVETASMDALGKMVVSRIQRVKGVTRTLTCPVVHI